MCCYRKKIQHDGLIMKLSLINNYHTSNNLLIIHSESEKSESENLIGSLTISLNYSLQKKDRTFYPPFYFHLMLVIGFNFNFAKYCFEKTPCVIFCRFLRIFSHSCFSTTPFLIHSFKVCIKQVNRNTDIGILHHLAPHLQNTDGLFTVTSQQPQWTTNTKVISNTGALSRSWICVLAGSSILFSHCLKY